MMNNFMTNLQMRLGIFIGLHLFFVVYYRELLEIYYVCGTSNLLDYFYKDIAISGYANAWGLVFVYPILGVPLLLYIEAIKERYIWGGKFLAMFINLFSFVPVIFFHLKLLLFNKVASGVAFPFFFGIFNIEKRVKDFKMFLEDTEFLEKKEAMTKALLETAGTDKVKILDLLHDFDQRVEKKVDTLASNSYAPTSVARTDFFNFCESLVTEKLNEVNYIALNATVEKASWLSLNAGTIALVGVVILSCCFGAYVYGQRDVFAKVDSFHASYAADQLKQNEVLLGMSKQVDAQSKTVATILRHYETVSDKIDVADGHMRHTLNVAKYAIAVANAREGDLDNIYKQFNRLLMTLQHKYNVQLLPRVIFERRFFALYTDIRGLKIK